MKAISNYVLAVLLGAIIGASITSYMWEKKKQKWMVAIELDRVTYSYAPLQSLEKGNTKEAKELLLSHLDDALGYYDKAARHVSGWDGTNVAIITGARELYTQITKQRNSEQGAGGYGSPAAGSPSPQP